MKKRTKITFSLTLVICLLLSILPAAPVVAVAAEETLTSSITESATIGTPTVAEETAAVQEELPVLQLDADCQILRHVDPEVFAAGNHIARLPEEETLSSYVFLNADGSKTAYFMDQPVKFENTDGAAVEKNLTLTAVTEGYTTTQNDIQLTIPTDPTNGIRLVYNNHYITLIPQGGTLTAGAQATDGSVTYPDYYGEGMSLRYTPTLSGVKEDILLDSYSGVNSFTFRLNTGGLKLYQASGRYFLAESKTSADRIELGDVVAYDANTQFSIGTMTAQTIMAGQAYMLTLTVDEAFLTDENTVYPVIIDPTMEVRASNSSSNIIDAPIFDGYPNTNYGNFIFNRVGKVSAYGVGRTVVKLPTLTESDTYTSLSADNITSVKFYVKEASGTAAISVSVYPLVGNSVWTESNVTWNNAGSADGAAIDTQSLSYTNWKSFDITDLVKKWKTGDYDANCGFIMIGSSTTNKSFFASEHSTTDSRPYVVMTYDYNLFYSDYSSSAYYVNTPVVEQYLWEDDGLQTRANCYGYAFRFFYGPKTFFAEQIYATVDDVSYGCYKQQPGEFADKSGGLTIYDSNNTACTTLYNRADLDAFLYEIFNDSSVTTNMRMNFLVQLMQADAETLGYSLTEYSGTEIPSAQVYNDRRLIAFVVSETDYHFYMQHSDDTWSHKPGMLQPTNQCFECELELTNENIQDHACEGYYSGGVLKFFYITKNAVVDYNHVRGTYTDCTHTVISDADRTGNHLVSAKNLGSTPAEATNMKFDYVGDIDCFAFTLNETGSYAFTTSTYTSFLLNLKLYNQQGVLLLEESNATGALNFTYQLAQGEAYVIAFTAPDYTTYGPLLWYSFLVEKE